MSAIGMSSEKSGFRPRSELSEITFVAFLVHCQVREMLLAVAAAFPWTTSLHGQRYGLIPRNQESNRMCFVRCKTSSGYETMILTPEQAMQS
jgi:hypothetical protein